MWRESSVESQSRPGECETYLNPITQQDECRWLLNPAVVGNKGPTPMVRADDSAENFYLQKYLKLVAPGPWTDYLASLRNSLVNAGANPNWTVDTANDTDTYPISESWPPDTFVPSRSGEDQIVSTMRGAVNPSGSGVASYGKISIASPQSSREAVLAEEAEPPPEQTRPQTELWLPRLRNGADEWVAPTPQAITAAIEAGAAEPLYAARNSVPGAWPITWTDEIHFPAEGLSVDKANIAAAMLRYHAVEGRERAESMGDGRITDAMAQQVLAAADAVVQSNCAAAGGFASDSGFPAELVPAGLEAALTSLGAVSWCVYGPEASAGSACRDALEPYGAAVRVDRIYRQPSEAIYPSLPLSTVSCLIE